MGFQSYPAKGLLRGQRGLNLVDYLMNIGPESMLKSKDMNFFRRTLRRRRGFTLHSTEDWSASTWRGGCEFQDDYGNARLLVARGDGKVKEIQDEDTSADVLTGLGADRETYFANGFGSSFMVNGDDPLQRIDATSNPALACTARVAGVPVPPTLTVTAGTAVGQTGDYIYTATAVIEDGAGNRLLESDWSILFQLTLANTKQSGTLVAGAVDARVTHYYIYRSEASGASPKYLTKCTKAAAAFTNVDVTDLALGAFAPTRGRNIAPPDAPELVALSGSRMVLAKGPVLYISPPSLNAYDVETFPYQLRAPASGAIKAVHAIPNPGATLGTNSLFFANETSCHVLPNTDPTQKVATLSPEIGIMNSAAIATRGRGIFWVDRKRGVIWWPGEGREIYAVGDKILSVITGKGYQGVAANIGDNHVSLTIWDDKLLLTVRDDSAKDSANKVYLMNLLAFEQDMLKVGPEAAAAWAGPWEGPGFYRFIPQSMGGLILMDNEYSQLSVWDETTFKDSLGGVDTAALPAVRLGTCLAEVLETNKRIHQVYLVAYSNANSLLRLIGEESRFDIPGIVLTAASYGDIEFEDIELVDIETAGQAWKSEGEIDWAAVAEWVLPEFSTLDGVNDWIWTGAKFLYTRTRITRTYA